VNPKQKSVKIRVVIFHSMRRSFPEDRQDLARRGHATSSSARIAYTLFHAARRSGAGSEPARHAALEEERAIADARDAIELVRRAHDRPADFGDEPRHLIHARGIELPVRLVEEHEVRILEQEDRHREPLAHARRVRAHGVLRSSSPTRDRCPGGTSFPRAGRRPRGSPSRRGPRRDPCGGRASPTRWRSSQRCLSGTSRRAAARPATEQRRRERAQERRLPRPVGARDHDALAFLHLQVDVRVGPARAEAPRQPPCLDDRRHASSYRVRRFAAVSDRREPWALEPAPGARAAAPRRARVGPPLRRARDPARRARPSREASDPGGRRARAPRVRDRGTARGDHLGPPSYQLGQRQRRRRRIGEIVEERSWLELLDAPLREQIRTLETRQDRADANQDEARGQAESEKVGRQVASSHGSASTPWCAACPSMYPNAFSRWP
jgi:hypothetical protein